MKHKIFDDFVKEKMDGLKPEVPSHIWDNIAKEGNQKKPIPFWFTSLGKIAAVLLITAGIGAGYYFLNAKKITQNNIASTKENKTIIDANNKTNNSNVAETNIVQEVKDVPVNKEDFIPSNSSNDNAGNYVSSNKTENKYTPTNINLNINNGIVEINSVNEQQLQLTANENRFNLLGYHTTFNPTINIPTLPKALYIPCPEAERNAAGNKKYIEVYGGPDYVFKSYEDTGNYYIEKRKERTSINYAFSAGMRYTKVFSNGMSFKTGINYSKIKEHFVSKDGAIINRVITTNANGDTVSNYLVSTPQFKKSKNVYHFVDIPVQIGYELGNGRFHANISAGVMVNIASKQKGNTIDRAGNTIDISSEKSDNEFSYKKTAGVSFLGSASVYYKISDRMHILAEPYLRYSLSNFTKPEETFKQKFHTAGVRLGVRMDLQ
jgi:opacity protein-like surface antigen